jgi:hypothetical protein
MIRLVPIFLGHQNAGNPAAVVGDHLWWLYPDIGPYYPRVIGITEVDIRPANTVLARQ